MFIDQIRVTVENGPLEEKEILYYINKIKKHSKGKNLKSLSFRLADDHIDLRYSFENLPLERIRRVPTPVSAEYPAARCIG